MCLGYFPGVHVFILILFRLDMLLWTHNRFIVEHTRARNLTNRRTYIQTFIFCISCLFYIKKKKISSCNFSALPPLKRLILGSRHQYNLSVFISTNFFFFDAVILALFLFLRALVFPSLIDNIYIFLWIHITWFEENEVCAQDIENGNSSAHDVAKDYIII